MGFSRGRALVACGVLSAIVIATWACSQGDPQPPFIPDPKLDASTSKVDAAKDAAKIVCLSDDGGCNALENCGPKVSVVDVAQTGTAGQGGTVLDGTYVLTDYRVFTGPGGVSGTTPDYFMETMKLVTVTTDGGTTSDAGDGGDGGATTQTMAWEDNVASTATPQSSSSSGVAQFTGSNIVITHTCPNATILSGTYTMSNTQLIVFVQDSTNVNELTYTKQ